jgi:phospholipase C
MKMKVSLAVLLSTAQICAVSSTNIEHVIVLMLENRSLDHMLGFLKQQNPEINGCLPNDKGCSNPVDPLDPASPQFTVDDTAVYAQVSPSHSISGTTKQIYGSADSTGAPNMNGFIKSYTSSTGSVEGGEGIMKCFSPSHVPVIANLSMEYGFFDGWYASVPGPTMVNRAYAASGTSHGMGTNDEKTIALGLPQKTMFKQLVDMGLDIRVYFQIAPSVLMFKDMRHKDIRGKYKPFPKLYEDLKTGDIPQFTWLEPNYFDAENFPSSDQHPDHDVSIGDKLIKDVYEAVRASPIWEKTALIITYDEHGGFFDHVAPPVNVPSPDGINSVDDPFDFTRLGVRVPTVVVSPWIPKGSVFHAPSDADAGQYEHSSLISTIVHKMFQPTEGHHKQPYLNKRDEWAATFEHIFHLLPSHRTNCPNTTPTPESHRSQFPNTLPPPDGKGPLSDLQREMLAIVAGATEDMTFWNQNLTSWNEGKGAKYCQERMNLYFGREMVTF